MKTKVDALNRALIAQRGNYLLEFAGVLAVLLPVVLGAIDVNSALQAYTAIREGAKTAARCVYPTDGACVDVSAFSSQIKTFDWYRGSLLNRYMVPYDNYSGTGYLLRGTRYTWDSYRAYAYTSISYDLPQESFQLMQKKRTRQQPLQVMIQEASLPRILGSDPEHPAGFVLRNDPTIRHRGELSTTIVNDSVTTTTTATLTIEPPAWSQAPWFGSIYCSRAAGADTSQVSALPDFSKPCDQLYQEEKPYYPVAFWIGGTARGGEAGVESGVAISMTYKAGGKSHRVLIGGDSSLDLGGQGFPAPGPNASSSENFYPRGFIQGAAASDLPPWATEPLMIPSDASEITVTLSPSDNFSENLRYEVTKFRAFAPIFSTASFMARCSTPSCENAPNKSPECDLEYNGQTFGPKSSQIAISSSVHKLSAAENQALAIGPADEITEEVPIGTSHIFPSINSAQKSLIPKTSACSYFVKSAGSLSPERRNDIPCPLDPIYGGFPANEAGCASILDEDATNVSYKTALVTAPQTPEEAAAFDWQYSWNKMSCAEEYSEKTFAPPSGLIRYSNFLPASFINGPGPTESEFDITSQNGEDPRLLIKSDGTYACGEFKITEVRFEGDTLPSPKDAAAQSLFAGIHPALTGTAGCMEKTLREEALRLGLPSTAYFEPDAEFVEEREQTDAPSGRCTSFRVKNILMGASKIASALPEGISPPGCPGPECYSVFAGVLSDSGTPEKIDIKKAEEWGSQALLATYPRAHFDCPPEATTPDCAWIHANQTGEIIAVEGSINVPFYFLGRTTQRMSFGTSRKLERSFLK